MILTKTEKAHHELSSGQRRLRQRERTLLLMADGSRTREQLCSLFPADAEFLLQNLVQNGYLTLTLTPGSPGARSNRAKPPVPAPVARRPEPEAPQPVTPPPQAMASGADPFIGRRSLATTRMFLFDICERLFSRRDPLLAERFRMALREARDRDTMLAVARDIIETVEASAGPERADAISERIAAMMPAGQE